MVENFRGGTGKRKRQTIGSTMTTISKGKNLEHPKPIFLAPTVNERGKQLSLAELDIDTRDVSRRVTAHEKLHTHHIETLHGKMDAALAELRAELVKTHARIEMLEARWYERLARWVKGVINAAK